MEAMNQFFKQHKSPSLGTAPLDCFFRKPYCCEKSLAQKNAVLNLEGALGTAGLSRSGRGVVAHQGPRITGALVAQ